MKIDAHHAVNPNSQTQKPQAKAENPSFNFTSAMASITKALEAPSKTVSDRNQAGVAGFDKNKFAKEDKKQGISQALEAETDELMRRIDGILEDK